MGVLLEIVHILFKKVVKLKFPPLLRKPKLTISCKHWRRYISLTERTLIISPYACNTFFSAIAIMMSLC